MSQLLGPFQLLRPIGKGGMAQVWRARHRDGWPVAVKVVTETSDRFVAALHEEIRAVAALDHPHVVAVFDAGVVDEQLAEEWRGSPWLAMELASDGDLGSRVGELAWGETRQVLLGLLDALAHAHARGVIHRDIKPANVLICGPEDGRPGLKLTDFGIAHHLSAHESEVRHAGTVSYCAPEQVDRAWRRFGPWTDLYALGCMAWELVTGRTPFHHVSPSERAAAHVGAPLPALRPGGAVPRGVEDWLRTLLAKAPEARVGSAAEASVGLRALDAVVAHNSGERLTPRLVMPTTGLTLTTVVPGVLSSVSRGPERPVVRLPVPTDWRTPELPPPPVALVGAGLGLFGVRVCSVAGRDLERDVLWLVASCRRGR